MPYRELAPKRTPVEPKGVVNATLLAWPNAAPLCRAAVELFTSQVGVETAWHGCMGYNMAGAKSHPNNGKNHWQFFSTREVFTQAELARCMAIAVDAGAVTIVGKSADGRTDVMLHPKHPWCCFKAFETLSEAVAEQIAFLQEKFPAAWQVLVAGGMPEEYASALRHGVHGAYFTCLESDYASALHRRLKEVKAATQDAALWGDVL